MFYGLSVPVVARSGFEPETSGLWILCSNQLSYLAGFRWAIHRPLLQTGRKNREKLAEKRAKEDWIPKEKCHRQNYLKNKKALCGNRRPSNDCLPYENSSKIDVVVATWISLLHSFHPRCGHKVNHPSTLKKELNITKKLKNSMSAKSFYSFPCRVIHFLVQDRLLNPKKEILWIRFLYFLRINFQKQCIV